MLFQTCNKWPNNQNPINEMKQQKSMMQTPSNSPHKLGDPVPHLETKPLIYS